ncbi:hypothetical protein EPO44_10670 [bacterium]|nr:MAG: hypothetical protein EPO44_10670 [bacterium]
MAEITSSRSRRMWRFFNILLAISLIGSCSYNFVRGIQGTPKQRELERIEGAIFELVAKVDPDHQPYDKYRAEGVRIERGIEYWNKEWDAIPDGAVIGERRGSNAWLTGHAKEISDNLERLRRERDNVLPALRREIARARASTIDSWPEGSRGSASAQEAKQLWIQRGEIAKSLREGYGTLEPNTMTGRDIARFYLSIVSLLYLLAGCPMPSLRPA